MTCRPWEEHKPPASPRIQSISPGLNQIIYLTEDGAVWTMGSNTHGQLGDGAMGREAWSSTPVSVALPHRMKQVGSGFDFCWALSAHGRSAYAWGDNRKGQLGIADPSVSYSTAPVRIKFDLPPGVSVVSMADGLWCSLALLSNGEVMAWGDNQYGQCGLNPKTAGQYIYKPTVIPGLTGVASLAAGDFYSMALKADGTVWTWGQNTFGQLGPKGPEPGEYSHAFVPRRVPGLPDIQEVIAGGRNAIALDDRGHIWEWGRNKFGELGRGVADLSDGAHPTPKMVVGLPRIVSVDSQGPTVLAADAHGHVYAWGFDRYGAVGDGQTASTGTPQLVLTLPTTPHSSGPSVEVAAAHFSSYAFNPYTGEIYAWGRNNYGQIGEPANGSANPTPTNITNEILPTLGAPDGGPPPWRRDSAVGASPYAQIDGGHNVAAFSSAFDAAAGAHSLFHPGSGYEHIHGLTEGGAAHEIPALQNSDAGMLATFLTHASYDGSSAALRLFHDSTEFPGAPKFGLWPHPGDFPFGSDKS